MAPWKKKSSAGPSGSWPEPEEVPGYQDLEQVGQGGFSVVYRARQTDLGREVALKVFTTPASDGQAMARFRRECRLTGRLTGHPNVVTVLDSGQTRSRRPYMAMEYFEFGSLRDRLEREGPLRVEEVLRIGVKIGGALGAAHEVGILHRDIKPQNILLSRYGEPALADFGVAHLVDTLNMSTHSQALTPFHAAPEVIQGGTVGKTCDVYSLGSTLHQLLVGRPAYSRSGDEGLAPLLLRIVSDPPPGIPRADVPRSLAETIQAAMAKRPDDRPADAFAFAARLQQVQAELGLPVTEVPRNLWSPAFSGSDATLPPPPPVATAASGSDAATRSDPAAHITAWPGNGPGAAVTGTPGGAGGPGQWGEQTVLRPDRLVTRQPAGERQRRGGVLPLVVAGAVVLAGAGVGLGLGIAGHRTPRNEPSASQPTSPPASRAVPYATRPPQSVIDAARPTGLTATDDGTSVVLHWRLRTGNGLPLLAQWFTAGAGGRSTPLPVRGGATTVTVTGLDAAKGYCFEVGTLVADTQPAVTMAWSGPACIRGASAAGN